MLMILLDIDSRGVPRGDPASPDPNVGASWEEASALDVEIGMVDWDNVLKTFGGITCTNLKLGLFL